MQDDRTMADERRARLEGRIAHFEQMLAKAEEARSAALAVNCGLRGTAFMDDVAKNADRAFEAISTARARLIVCLHDDRAELAKMVHVP